MAIDKTYTHSEFRGQIHCPAPVTPFAANGDLMLDAFEDIVGYHLDTSADTMLIAGDNGEGYVLSEDELARVTETAARVIAGRFPFYVHVSRLSTDECIARARVAADAGANGICLTPHSYLGDGTRDEIVIRYEALAKAVALPVMVYNCPKHTGINITTDTLEAICDVAPVNILKEGNGVIEHATNVIGAFGHRFSVLIGLARGLVPCLLLGSGGFVGTGPELFGSGARRVFEVHTMTPDERMEIHARWGEVILAASFAGTSPAGIKAALNMLGLPAGVPRAPVLALGPEAEAKLAADLVANGVLEGALAKRA